MAQNDALMAKVLNSSPTSPRLQILTYNMVLEQLGANEKFAEQNKKSGTQEFPKLQL